MQSQDFVQVLNLLVKSLSASQDMPNNKVSKSKESCNNNCSDLLGEFVVVRCREAGVHAGVLTSMSDRNVVLKDSRRLWAWTCTRGDFLSGVAKFGINQEKSKIGTTIETLILPEVCEVISTTEASMESIMTTTPHNE